MESRREGRVSEPIVLRVKTGEDIQTVINVARRLIEEREEAVVILFGEGKCTVVSRWEGCLSLLPYCVEARSSLVPGAKKVYHADNGRQARPCSHQLPLRCRCPSIAPSP